MSGGTRKGAEESFRERYRVPLMLLPIAAGVGTAIPLWGAEARPLFFSTACEVLTLGAVALALQGRFFRLGARSRAVTASTLTILVSVGVGLAFAFGALVRGDAGGDPHVALTAGALAMGVSAFAIMAILGAPGAEEDVTEEAS